MPIILRQFCIAQPSVSKLSIIIRRPNSSSDLYRNLITKKSSNIIPIRRKYTICFSPSSKSSILLNARVERATIPLYNICKFELVLYQQDSILLKSALLVSQLLFIGRQLRRLIASITLGRVEQATAFINVGIVNADISQRLLISPAYYIIILRQSLGALIESRDILLE